VCKAQYEILFNSGGETDKARLRASCANHSGAWIDALPSVGLGLRLENGETSISISLCIGAPIALSHNCMCGSKVLPDGHHGLSYRRSSGGHSLHTSINQLIPTRHLSDHG